MTLPEAIKILETFHDKAACYLDATSANAFQLGIEAMKRCGWQRCFPDSVILERLPGETSD